MQIVTVERAERGERHDLGRIDRKSHDIRLASEVAEAYGGIVFVGRGNVIAAVR